MSGVFITKKDVINIEEFKDRECLTKKELIELINKVKIKKTKTECKKNIEPSSEKKLEKYRKTIHTDEIYSEYKFNDWYDYNKPDINQFFRSIMDIYSHKKVVFNTDIDIIYSEFVHFLYIKQGSII
tara:strand:+ start:554 stop:934 length:381 start_codon:yes stop_codon:yes gene_type:complete